MFSSVFRHVLILIIIEMRLFNFPFMGCQKATLLASVLIVSLLFTPPTSATGPQEGSGWQLATTDCAIKEGSWQSRTLRVIDSSEPVQQLHFQCGGGSKLIIAHDVPPAFAIDELEIQLDVNSARDGIRSYVRVVLPYSQDVNTQRPIQIELEGSTYSTSGSWQSVGFQRGQIRKTLEKRKWVLRQQHGQHVTLRGAYVDQVRLNLYSRPGSSTVLLANPRLTGIVAAKSIAQTYKSDPNGFSNADPVGPNRSPSITKTDHQSSFVKLKGSVVEVRDKPFFAKIIQHNGEPFEYLKKLGFNTIQLSSPPSQTQLQSAQALKLWLICPPPASVGISKIPFSYDPVLAWSVGSDVNGRHLVNIRQTIREIRESDLRLGRPIVASIGSHIREVGREVDILNVGVRPIGTSFIASGYEDWISEQRQKFAGMKPIWADIQTQLAPQAGVQVRALNGSIPPIPIQPQQIQFLTYRAIAGGARGLRFLSRDRLDDNDPESKLRCWTLQWVLRQAELFEPWAMAGVTMGPLNLNPDKTSLEVSEVKTRRARLLLVNRVTHTEQYWAGDLPIQSIEFLDRSAYTDSAYQVTEAGIVPIRSGRVPAGLKIVIPDCPTCAAVVTTQNPNVVAKLNKLIQTSTGQESTLRLHMKITRQWLAIMQLIDEQLGRLGKRVPSAASALNQAVVALRQAADSDLRGNHDVSLKSLNRADQRIALARREIMTLLLGQFKSKTSSPLLLHTSLIPIHLELSNRLSNLSWKHNSLPGGDFENLRHMTDNGWLNRKDDRQDIHTSVTLSEDAAVDGKYGLVMTVSPVDQKTEMGSTPIWIQTCNVPVKAGQLIRIHGWINIPQTISHSHSGLLISDSIAGSDLAERIPITDGWQEFTLYRGVEKDGPLNVTFALTGYGTAMIDEVTIRTIDVPPPEPAKSRQARATSDHE